MFVIKSKFENQIEIENTLENVRDFFSDPKNFVTLMNGVESIKALSETLNRWIIRVDVPIIGSIKQEFLVERTADSDEFIEWSPAKTERQNFLRFSADYFVKSANKTVVRLLQMVELYVKERRNFIFWLQLRAKARSIRKWQNISAKC